MDKPQGFNTKTTLTPFMDERFPIELPVRRRSLLSHRDNVAYGIEMLQNRPGHVIGYLLVRVLGVRERYHHVEPLEVAEHYQEQNRKYHYFTLENLLEKQEQINPSAIVSKD